MERQFCLLRRVRPINSFPNNTTYHPRHSVLNYPDETDPHIDCPYGVSLPRTFTWRDDERLGGTRRFFYKKFTDVPFTGNITGKTEQGTIKNGKKEGLWVRYYDNGQLQSKGTYKDGMFDDPWVVYHKNGQLWSKGTWKDGKFVEE